MAPSADTEQKRAKVVAYLLGISILIAGSVIISSLRQASVAPPSELVGVLRHDFKVLPPFELSDHNNRLINEASFDNKWTFIFFGYTSCPDICPITLSVLSSMIETLQDKGENVADDVQVMLVSVDPARDTPELLAKYVTHFNPDFVGASGNKQQVDQFTQQFGAGYIIEEETAPGQYLVAHTSAIFLVDPAGRLVATFSQPHYAETIATQFKQIRKHIL